MQVLYDMNYRSLRAYTSVWMIPDGKGDGIMTMSNGMLTTYFAYCIFP